MDKDEIGYEDNYWIHLSLGIVIACVITIVVCLVSLLLSAPLQVLAVVGAITAFFTVLPALGWIANKIFDHFWA